MKLAISNIAWEADEDTEIFQAMKKMGYTGLEIAPTRIVDTPPYEKLIEAKRFQKKLFEEYEIEICSMQSIWYGCSENLFDSEMAREELLNYTRKALSFAQQIKCSNLVFGSPKNRNMNESANIETAKSFFAAMAELAQEKKIAIAIEANPTIYGTNFLNTTKEAICFVREINSPWLRVNLDVGTIIENNESLDELLLFGDLIHHVHISEPHLELIRNRDLHKEVFQFLRKIKYNGFVSIEMKKQNLQDVFPAMRYISEIFLEQMNETV